MRERTLAEHLDFLVSERGQDEASVLAEALRTGIEALYREALTEAYLLGRVSREAVLAELGQDDLELVEQQRDALRRDIRWARRVSETISDTGPILHLHEIGRWRRSSPWLRCGLPIWSGRSCRRGDWASVLYSRQGSTSSAFT